MMGALKVTSKRFRFNQINEVLRNDNNHSISLLRRLFCQTFNFPSLDTEMKFHECCLLSHPHPLSINCFSTNHCSLRFSLKFSLGKTRKEVFSYCVSESDDIVMFDTT